MSRWLRSHQTAAEAALDGGKTHGSFRKFLQLSIGGQIRWQLASVRQCEVMIDAESRGDGTSKNHGLRHHHSGGTRLRDLHGQFALAAANPTFRQIHEQSTLTAAPATSAFQKSVKLSEIRVFGRSEIDQLIRILIGQSVTGSDPAAQDSEVADRPLLIEIDPGAPGRIAPTGSDAERTCRKFGGKHRKIASGEIETAASTSSLKIQR